MAITALPIDVWLKERLKKWVQLSGHEGSIVPATTCTLYKKQTGNCMEARAYENISKDPALTGFTPRYFKQLQKNDECFIEIEDLLQQFADPTKTSIMDIKIGTRTFLEFWEVINTRNGEKDLYEKMTAIDPDEPTPEERACGEITKLRYMQFRERESSSAELGFRIEAAKMPGGSLQKNFKKVRTYDDVTQALIEFFGTDRERIRSRLLARLKAMRSAIEKSHFFATHEVVGSSVLIVHDHEKVNCWMIDFAKSSPVDPTRRLDHRTPWVQGNSEDGYLLGVDNLIKLPHMALNFRTFLESEVSNTKRRKDLYEKMTAIDPDEPTPEERACGEITKLRYMQFRERESSSAELGFRIEAAKVSLRVNN
ncbi:inositol-pentakisphosphate 2-kinase [Cooperia oncophora]